MLLGAAFSKQLSAAAKQDASLQSDVLLFFFFFPFEDLVEALLSATGLCKALRRAPDVGLAACQCLTWRLRFVLANMSWCVGLQVTRCCRPLFSVLRICLTLLGEKRGGGGRYGTWFVADQDCR